MIVQLKFRRGTSAQWAAANPVLDAGEPGYDTDTDRFKIGNGTDVWGALVYQSFSLESLTESLDELDAAVTAAQTAASEAQAAASEVDGTAYMQKSANLSDVANPTTARASLGIGSAGILSSTTILLVANNLSDLSSAATARTNLGLGTAATTASTAYKSSSYAPAASDLTASGTRDNTTYLRGDNTWSTPIDTTGGGGGGASETIDTEVMFSSLTGATDDIKLDSFMNTQKVLTKKGRTLVLDEVRDYTFNTQHVLYNGFSIRGPFRPQDQARSSQPIGNKINLGMTGGWFTLPPPVAPATTASCFGVSMSNMSINGTSSNRLVEGSSTTVLWTSNFRDISMQNAAGVLGSPTQQLLLTASTIDGWWNVNNVRDRAFCVGGSDSWIQPTMMLLDSPPSMRSVSSYLMSLDSLSNAWISNIYCTSDLYAGLLINGGSSGVNGQSVWITNCVWEGRNEGDGSTVESSLGAIIRQTGGSTVLRDCRIAFGMSDPAQQTSRTDLGVIHVSGGHMMVDGCSYQRAYVYGSTTTWLAPSVPFLYATGTNTRVRIRNIRTGFPWAETGDAAKPTVRQSVAGLIDADNSVNVVTDGAAVSPAGDITNTTSGFTNAGTSLVINKPSATVTGDVLVAAVYGRNNSVVYPTPPAGWVERAPSTDNVTAGVVRFYTKVITSGGTEPASYTWAGGSSGRHVGTILRITGANLTTPLNVAGAVATLISGPDRVILPGVTPTQSGLLIGLAAANTTGGLVTTFTAAGMASIASASTNTAASESGLTVMTEAVSSAATSTRSAVSSQVAGSGLGYMIVIDSA